MLDIRDKHALTTRARKQDISSWQEVDITKLNSKAKKRFIKYRSAVVAFFTTDKPVEEITARYHLSNSQLLKMTDDCLKLYADGTLWGFRALLPGAHVKDHTPAVESTVAADSDLDEASSLPAALPSETAQQYTNEEATPADEAAQTASADSQLESLIEPVKQRVQEDEGSSAIPVEQSDQKVEKPSIEPVEQLEEDELEATAQRPAIQLDAASEPAVDQPSAPVEQEQGEDEQSSSEPEVTPSLVSEPVPAPSETSTSDDASVLASTEAEAVEEDDLTSATQPLLAPSSTEVPVEEEPSLSKNNDEELTDSETVPRDDQPTVEEVVPPVAPSLTEAEQQEIVAEESRDEEAKSEEDSSVETAIEEDEEAEDEEDDRVETSIEEDEEDEDNGLVEPSSDKGTPGEVESPSSFDQSEADEQEEPYEDEKIAFTPIEGEERAITGSEVALLPPSTRVVPVQTTGPHLLPKFARQSRFAKIAQRRRTIRRRWTRDTQDKGKQKRFLRVVSMAIVAVILLGLLLPIGVGMAAYGVYNNVNGLAHSGINHLLTVKDLLPVSKSDPMAALNAQKLEQAQSELKAAQLDFEQLQQLTDRSDIQSLTQQFSPDYANKLVMARHLVKVALDVSRMGQELSGIGVIAAGIVHSSPLATNSAKPLVSVQDIALVKGAIVHALYYIDDIQQNMSQVNLNDLPINAKQKTQLTSVLTQLPTIRDTIVQNQGLIDVVTWLLGVGQPRHFLVQTMDNAELRPGGGFTGQYGLLTINNGRMDPFTLRDVALLDYAGNGMELGRQAPPEYRSWMNFGNWGLRDSNLSGDYPTTARMNMQVFQEEGGGPVDGDIAFTPNFIGHILDVTGPIHVAEYNETITSSNLANRLHYYQQDYNAIALEHQKSNDNSHQARKAFTSLLGKMLLDRVRHLPTKQLLNVIKGAAKDLESRDLEIYFSNTAVEQWLTDHGYSGGLDTFSKQDGFALVQANISISKASQYVHTTEQDRIALDAQGGATHNLTITLDYNQTGPVYGYDTYADYMRLYVPHSSQLQSGDGFDSGHALCSAPTPTPPGKKGIGGTPAPISSSCNSRTPSDSIYCPSGNYSLGMRGFQRSWSVDSISGPTATTSDLPNRGMFGGLTATPKNCTATIALSWYVPNAVKHNGKHVSYTLFVQKQGGYIPTLDVSVDTGAVKGMKPFSFKGNLAKDRAFTAHN